MRILSISREEAIQLIEDDKRIDKGEKLFELDPELAKGAKKARQTPRKTTNYNFAQKEKKAKPEKEEICNAMIEGLKSINAENFDIKNPEREFEFTFGGVGYKVVLSVPRKK